MAFDNLRLEVPPTQGEEGNTISWKAVAGLISAAAEFLALTFHEGDVFLVIHLEQWCVVHWARYPHVCLFVCVCVCVCVCVTVPMPFPGSTPHAASFTMQQKRWRSGNVQFPSSEWMG